MHVGAWALWATWGLAAGFAFALIIAHFKPGYLIAALAGSVFSAGIAFHASGVFHERQIAEVLTVVLMWAPIWVLAWFGAASALSRFTRKT